MATPRVQPNPPSTSPPPTQLQTPPSYTSIKTTLLTYPHILSSLPTSPHKPHSLPLRNALASLSLHPLLEATLHLLNVDLPAAHFLCRQQQMEGLPEGMLVHAILHRIEGDYENARAWYADVDLAEMENRGEGDEQGGKGLLDEVWPAGCDEMEMEMEKGEEGGKEAALRFVDDVERWRKGGQAKGEEKERLRGISLRELVNVLRVCEERVVRDGGSGDVLKVKKKEKLAEQQKAMITGGEGWREF